VAEIETNKVSMKRGWRDHSAFEGDPYSRMDAWGWIIENALWKDLVVSVNGSPVPLKRGQLSYSTRYLAEKWKWGKSSVARFLKHLKKWDMADTESGTGQMIITVCNYDKYQLIPKYKRDTSGTATDTQAGQERDKGGTNKNVSKNVGNVGNENIIQRPENVSERIWVDFLAIRKTKKAVLTQTALDGIVKEAAKAGWTLEAALTKSCERGWAGFEASWVNQQNQKSHQPQGGHRP
jgi:hypothetical protein